MIACTRVQLYVECVSDVRVSDLRFILDMSVARVSVILFTGIVTQEHHEKGFNHKTTIIRQHDESARGDGDSQVY